MQGAVDFGIVQNIMQSFNAVSLTSNVRGWLANSHQPRILHIFDHACNLINERREVLSIVTPQIGNGPFNLVIPGLRKSVDGLPDWDESLQSSKVFSNLSVQAPVSNSTTQLILGDLIINTTNAKLWSPCPDWKRLHAQKEYIVNQLTKLLIIDYQVRGLDTLFAKTAQGYSTTISPQSLISNLSSALVTANIPYALTITSQLAGLGNGLTPAGDDFILGAVLAVWIIHQPGVARVLAEEITTAATPLTTSLSAAWLRSAGKGEAGVLWHEFFAALLPLGRVANPRIRLFPTSALAVQEAMDKILAVGETSGADAMAGFMSTLKYWAGLKSPKTP
jgi:hypothetical protein